MADVLVVLLMVVAAFAPFALATWWMQRGRVGYTLTLFSLAGAALTLSIFAASRPVGVDPVQAMSWAMLFFLPAVLGCSAGALLGWLIYRRRFGASS